MALPETLAQQSQQPLELAQANLVEILGQQPSVDRAVNLETATNEVLTGIGVDALVAGADYQPSETEGSFDYRAKLAIGMAEQANTYGIDAQTSTETLAETLDKLKFDLFALEHPEDESAAAPDANVIAAKKALISSIGRKVTDARAAGPQISVYDI